MAGLLRFTALARAGLAGLAELKQVTPGDQAQREAAAIGEEPLNPLGQLDPCPKQKTRHQHHDSPVDQAVLDSEARRLGLRLVAGLRGCGSRTA